MKTPDQQLDRLFRAAARVSQPSTSAPTMSARRPPPARRPWAMMATRLQSWSASSM